MKRYTSENFWEEYWENLKLPVTIDKNFNQEKVISDLILKYVPNGGDEKKCIEIGCAPGRWLIFLNKELKYKIEGVEYLEIACKKTVENFNLNGIEDFKLTQEDFFSLKTEKRYNLVASFGFIEHFDDTELVFNKHCELVGKEGFLVIGLPNLRGVNHFIQSIIDLWIPDGLKYLKTHNLKSMNLKEYKILAEQNNFEIKFIDFVGGFEPALFPTGYLPSGFFWSGLRTLLCFLMRFFQCFFPRSNNPKISSYILMILKKR